MLQQTRVAAVIPYYERFLERFPNVASLAEAPEEELLGLWSGLGYYSRARNLRKAARRIVELGGFPREYDEIRKLPGVGDYTAAAIASIAFGRPRAVVDGNVLRVLSRLTDDATDIRSAAARRRFAELGRRLLDPDRPGRFNQALMELGATLCLPKQPDCPSCPVAGYCEARRAGTQAERPVKSGRTDVIRIDRTVLVIERAGKVLLRKRSAGSVRMAGFWELPEAAEASGAEPGVVCGSFRHSITNHNYRITVRRASIDRAPGGFRWIEAGRLGEIPLSTTAKKALRIARLGCAIL